MTSWGRHDDLSSLHVTSLNQSYIFFIVSIIWGIIKVFNKYLLLTACPFDFTVVAGSGEVGARKTVNHTYWLFSAMARESIKSVGNSCIIKFWGFLQHRFDVDLCGLHFWDFLLYPLGLLWWRIGSGLDCGPGDPSSVPDYRHTLGLTACWPSDGKEIEEVFRRPGARVGVGAAFKTYTSSPWQRCLAAGQIWKLEKYFTII